ncbi:MAG TPA: FKBP-type peptidyl-prolyl cis-trans isomerase [Gemmatimonadales bacterium]|nr:FKBP-type peptidyl-prolyl cis-trans isomerase [Gemmatimonadales bacterium]
MKQNVLASAAIAATLAGCGGAKTPPEPISNSPASIAEARFADTLRIDLAQFQTSAEGLYWRDVRIGEGEEVTAGRTVSAPYEGWLPVFEASRPGSPIAFPVGTGRVIPGWDQGLLGMRVGSIRRLIIPPALAYGAAGGGPIPPNATLIFDVEIMDVE